jgi:hypothetical protein
MEVVQADSLSLSLLTLLLVTLTYLKMGMFHSIDVEDAIRKRLLTGEWGNSEVRLSVQGVRTRESPSVRDRLSKFVRKYPEGYVFVELRVRGPDVDPDDPFDERLLQEHAKRYDLEIEYRVQPTYDSRGAYVQLWLYTLNPDTIYDFFRGLLRVVYGIPRSEYRDRLSSEKKRVG